jgi:hypothetical protein
MLSHLCRPTGLQQETRHRALGWRADVLKECDTALTLTIGRSEAESPDHGTIELEQGGRD